MRDHKGGGRACLLPESATSRSGAVSSEPVGEQLTFSSSSFQLQKKGFPVAHMLRTNEKIPSSYDPVHDHR